ncbi:LysM peptidoglycan-binding domain-containing protein [Natranaerobius thermophilus]|uniref:Peptidoglycan-binding LysM n=1 Tax=Natranaerobius thermophilus (strain ATCC BAA-1301 / DSM 18059 / JW/NM-WN-LF) TaxID=457570 RepID=B2A3Y5_NATTJ|nr:LysM peptidoglycan-binding domain-containing protein [Natranaerobius thermophilus]ACB85087.1 Peptidoglycan-binding LysM [Natranaerobius thermophilus JW/NM-WN-LF]
MPASIYETNKSNGKNRIKLKKKSICLIIFIFAIVAITSVLLHTTILASDKQDDIINEDKVSYQNKDANDDELEYEKVIINEGDTLWNIAIEHTNENQDPRKSIEEIRQLNDMDCANITVGEKIKVPESN